MPTGYTAHLVEHGEDFRAFALRCARNFGACITLRDAPTDTPIPEAFKPSPWYEQNAAESRATLSQLQAMAKDERQAYGEQAKVDKVASLREMLQRETVVNARLANMAETVAAWKPPTADHAKLKTFMLQQIELSHNDTDYLRRDLKAAQRKAPLDYWTEAVEASARRIAYCDKEAQEDRECCIVRTAWIQALRDSLPAAEPVSEGGGAICPMN